MTTVDQDGLEWFRMDQDRLEGLEWTRVRRFEGLEWTRVDQDGLEWTRVDKHGLSGLFFSHKTLLESSLYFPRELTISRVLLGAQRTLSMGAAERARVVVD